MKTKFNLSAEYDRNAAEALFEKLVDAGDVITLVRHTKPRSDNQNRYYRALVAILSDYTGFTPDETHELCKRYCGLHYTTKGVTTWQTDNSSPACSLNATRTHLTT